MTDNAQRLVHWYKTQARSFLEKHCAEKVEEFDRDCGRLQKASSLMGEDLSVCFLGNSGVGKSTLINALTGGGQAVVPSGGVGPLTAQALTVRYGESPKIAAEYHSRERLNQLVFGLENSWKSELGAPGEELAELTDEEGESLYADMVAEVEEDELSNRERHRRDTKSVAELLITGKQSADVTIRYLVDGLRDALGHGRPWAPESNPEDAQRIARIRGALALAKKGERFVREGTPTELATVLNDHACGFLAPLIRKATVWWNSPLLQSGVTLVDLPGLGVIGDPRPEITRKFIRESAKALVLVVDHRGVTEPVAQLLRQSEFLNRLLHTSDEPEGNPVLLIAITKVDDIARTRRLGDKSRSFAAHFAAVCEEMVPFIRNQLRNELESIWKDDGELHRSKQEVIDRLLATLRVHPISAVEFEALVSDDGAETSGRRSNKYSCYSGLTRRDPYDSGTGTGSPRRNVLSVFKGRGGIPDQTCGSAVDRRSPSGRGNRATAKRSGGFYGAPADPVRDPAGAITGISPADGAPADRRSGQVGERTIAESNREVFAKDRDSPLGNSSSVGEKRWQVLWRDGRQFATRICLALRRAPRGGVGTGDPERHSQEDE